MQIKYNFTQNTESPSFMFYRLLNAYVRYFPFPHRGLRYFLKAMRQLGISNNQYTKKLAGNISMHVNPEEHIQRQLFWYGHYEKELEIILKKIICPDSVIIDTGANIGYFTLLAARLAPHGKVIAMEPVSYLYEALQKNILLNRFKTIIPIKAAAGEMNIEKIIYLSGADNWGMSSFQKPENYSGQEELVTVISTDDWVKESGLKKVDIIKIDVEGYELQALKGMKETLSTYKPYVLIEVNPETLSMFHLTPADILKFIEEVSYRPFLIGKSGKLKPTDDRRINKSVNVLMVHNDNLQFVVTNLV